MDDKKLTDNEIIKALECCIDGNCCKENCPIYDERDSLSRCTSKLSRFALYLINRQKVNIDGLQQLVNLSIDTQNEMNDTIIEQKEEIERLEKENTAWMNDNNAKAANIEYLSKIVTATDKLIITAKAEAIKEFAEGLKENIRMNGFCEKFVFESDIDNLVKEMVGEDNG